MMFDDDTKKLLHNNELLRSIIEVRDNSLKTIVKEVYENSGQLLCLVLLKLAIIERQNKTDIKEEVTDLSNLITEVVKNLRHMCSNFYPENKILSEYGLITVLKQELEIDPDDNSNKKLKIKGTPCDLLPGTSIILFQIIVEIRNLINRYHPQDAISIEIIYKITCLQVRIIYPGGPIDLDQENISDNFYEQKKLSVYQRMDLIGARLTIEKKRKTKIVLTANYN